MKKNIAIGVALLAVVAVASGLAWLVTDRSDQRNDKAAQPLQATASTFIPPAGARQAMEDTTKADPPTAVRGWSWDGSIDDACNQWRDAYRSWVGATALGEVQGEVVEGQSCRLEGKKDGYSANLAVAVYGSAPPQATLTVTQ